jgi:hypothetical protein
MVAPATTSDRNLNQPQQPPTSPSTPSTTTHPWIEFFDIPSLHVDPLPLCQPPFSQDSDISSTVSDFSILSTDSLLSVTSTSLLEPEATTIPTARDHRAANPGTLNEEWQTFFRRSLVADDPNRATAPPVEGTTRKEPPTYPHLSGPLPMSHAAMPSKIKNQGLSASGR